MIFYGRDRQVKQLMRFFRGSDLRVALVYGRRRVGKSELIKHSLRSEDTRQLYYECKQTTELNNVESLSALISDLFQMPQLGFSVSGGY